MGNIKKYSINKQKIEKTVKKMTPKSHFFYIKRNEIR
jgi:hypothetical protein